MPELMEKIFNNLNNEFYSLYSCALVSRHWCEMSIPILWRDPFSSYKSLMFITRYFASLNEMEKLGLKRYGIIIDFANTLFDYASFLKVLNLHRLCSNVYHWIPNQSRNTMLVVNIVNLLLKIFIKSGATLSTLNLRANSIEIKPDVIYLLEQNKCFLSQLKDVT
ncbi:1967_t:CDS:1, partial [Cetraspora pellucida]